jgi:hypothetical protein
MRAPDATHETELAQFMREAVSLAVHDALFSPLSLGERHDIRLKPGFETACWSYLPPHRIYVGMELFGKARKDLTRQARGLYVRSHVHHELAHAHFTERNLRQVQAELTGMGVPFALFNLFEDARIEHRYRAETGYRFRWLQCEDLNVGEPAAALLFALVQAEGAVRTVTEALRKGSFRDASGASVEPNEEQRGQTRERLAQVQAYYKRIVAAPTSQALYPLLKEWLDEFGKPQNCPARGNESGAGQASPAPQGGESAETPDKPGQPGNATDGTSEEQCDLALSASLQGDPMTVAEFEMGTLEVDIRLADGRDTVPPPSRRLVTASQDLGPVGKKGDVLHRHAATLDEDAAQKVANRLKPFFATKVRSVATHTPQRRLSARAYALDRAPYRRKELEGKARRRIVLVIDCSGSMSGVHIDEGRTLVRALSLLAEQGFVEGHVVLSAVNHAPNWETWKLPMPADKIAHIQGYAGAEGLEYAMKGNLELVTEADFVFVYTDAQICDRPIDKTEFHRFAVYTWGLYAGGEPEPGILAALQRYFDKAIMRPSALELVDAMLTQR